MSGGAQPQQQPVQQQQPQQVQAQAQLGQGMIILIMGHLGSRGKPKCYKHVIL